MDKEYKVQIWFYIDRKEFPNLISHGLAHIPRIGEQMEFPDHFDTKKFMVVDVTHSFREEPDIMIQDIYIYSDSAK